MSSCATSPLALPIPSLHGTPVDDLREAFLTARAGIRTMLTAIHEACPNGRDYYPQGPNAYRSAADGHQACVRALEELGDEMLSLAEFQDCPQPRSSAARRLLDTTPKQPQVYPTIHTNGTSYEVLKNTAVAVFRSSQSVESDLVAIMPNLRDYDSAVEWQRARDQHADRIELIRRVGGYHLQVAIACRNALSPTGQGDVIRSP